MARQRRSVARRRGGGRRERRRRSASTISQMLTYRLLSATGAALPALPAGAPAVDWVSASAVAACMRGTAKGEVGGVSEGGGLCMYGNVRPDQS